jgi:hypothetical protein
MDGYAQVPTVEIVNNCTSPNAEVLERQSLVSLMTIVGIGLGCCAVTDDVLQLP